MNSQIQNKLKSIFSIIVNATGFISALLTIFATSIAAAVLAWLADQRFLLIPLVAFSLGVLVSLVAIIIIYLRTWSQLWWQRGYKWISADYTYRIHDDDPKHHSQTIAIKIKALRSGVELFYNRYQWSGQGKEYNPQILSATHTLMSPILQLTTWHSYYVYLGRTLSKGEIAQVKILQELYDSEGKFDNFLAKVVVEPLDELVLRMVFPKDYKLFCPARFERKGGGN